LLVSQFMLTESAIIQSMSLYVNFANGNVQMAIYDTNGSNNPNNLLGQTGVQSPSQAGWFCAPLTSPLSVGPGTYNLVFMPDNGAFETLYSSSGTYFGYTESSFNLPSTFPIPTSSGSFHYSIYATYTCPTTTITTTSSPTTTTTTTTPPPTTTTTTATPPPTTTQTTTLLTTTLTTTPTTTNPTSSTTVATTPASTTPTSTSSIAGTTLSPTTTGTHPSYSSSTKKVTISTTTVSTTTGGITTKAKTDKTEPPPNKIAKSSSLQTVSTVLIVILVLIILFCFVGIFALLFVLYYFKVLKPRKAKEIEMQKIKLKKERKEKKEKEKKSVVQDPQYQPYTLETPMPETVIKTTTPVDPNAKTAPAPSIITNDAKRNYSSGEDVMEQMRNKKETTEFTKLDEPTEKEEKPTDLGYTSGKVVMENVKKKQRETTEFIKKDEKTEKEEKPTDLGYTSGKVVMENVRKKQRETTEIPKKEDEKTT